MAGTGGVPLYHPWPPTQGDNRDRLPFHSAGGQWLPATPFAAPYAQPQAAQPMAGPVAPTVKAELDSDDDVIFLGVERAIAQPNPGTVVNTFGNMNSSNVLYSIQIKCSNYHTHIVRHTNQSTHGRTAIACHVVRTCTCT